MHIENSRIIISFVFAVLAAPALADDCTTVKSAMLNSEHTPHTVIVPRPTVREKRL